MTEDRVSELLENKELMQTLRELVMDGFKPKEIHLAAIGVYLQLERISTGGNK